MLKPLLTLEGHTDRVWTLAWNPSGTILASSGADKTIRLWAQDKSDNWVCISILTDTHSKSIRRLCWSPCGNYLASASFDATVCIWKRNSIDASWSTVVNLEGHENEIKSVAWSSDGNYLASCGRDKTIWIWERAAPDPDDVDEVDSAEIWDCSDLKSDHTKDVKHVVWHPNYNILVSCSYDDTIKVFHKDGDDWICYQTLNGHSSTVWSADFSACGQYLATSSDDKTVRIWKNHAHDKLPNIEPNSWKCVSVIQGYHSRSIYDVSWCKQNDVIVSASGDNSLVLYDRSTVEPQDGGDIFICIEKINQTHDCDVNSVAWNPKFAGLLASGSDDRKIKLWTFSSHEKGIKPMTIVDEIMKSLSEASLKTDAPINTETNPSESKLTINVTDFPKLLNFIETLQRLQDEISHDEEIHTLEKLFDLKIIIRSPRPISISGLNFNDGGLVKEFFTEVVNPKGESDKYKMIIDLSQFGLRLPRRSVKLVTVANELFLIEKTGDLYKILPTGENQLILGHLFTFSDLQFVTNNNQSAISYVISADRDEKIRVSNYPNTFDIERYCFGHRNILRRLIVVDEKKLLSIDQKNEICLWNLECLDDKSSNQPLVPVRRLSLDETSLKRLCVR